MDMTHKKDKSDIGSKKRFSVAVKNEIIANHDNGIRVSDIVKEYNIENLSISAIITNKEEFKPAEVAKGVNVISKQRSKVLDEFEKLLLNIAQ